MVLQKDTARAGVAQAGFANGGEEGGGGIFTAFTNKYIPTDAIDRINREHICNDVRAVIITSQCREFVRRGDRDFASARCTGLFAGIQTAFSGQIHCTAFRAQLNHAAHIGHRLRGNQAVVVNHDQGGICRGREGVNANTAAMGCDLSVRMINHRGVSCPSGDSSRGELAGLADAQAGCTACT